MLYFIFNAQFYNAIYSNNYFFLEMEQTDTTRDSNKVENDNNDIAEDALPGLAQPKTKYKKDGAYCCVPACDSRKGDSRKGREKLSFFKVKRADDQRTLAWATAINRKNQFGGLWMPSKNTFICGKHFLDGKPSNDSGSPDFIPSKWPLPAKSSLAKKPKTEQDKKRFQRLANRAQNDVGNVSGQRNDSDEVKIFYSWPAEIYCYNGVD